MTPEKHLELINKLVEKGAIYPCPRCGNKNFSLLNGYTLQSIQDEPKGFVLGGRGMPAVMATCTNCGFISYHALGALEKLQEKIEKEEKAKEEKSEVAP